MKKMRRRQIFGSGAGGEGEGREAGHVGRGAHLSGLEISGRAKDLVAGGAPGSAGATCMRHFLPYLPHKFEYIHIFFGLLE